MEEVTIPTRAPIAEEPKKEKHIPNHPNPRKGRRTMKKMVRESWGRENLLNERREAEEKRERKRLKREAEPTPPEVVMWREFTDEVKRLSKGDEVREDEFQPTPRRLIGVVTHPVNYQKDESYHHQPLTNPSHLWCNEVHATDADVMRGNRKKG